MQFTPQQLTGGPRYGTGTRLGNWSEDQELQDIQMKDYLKKKETGQLKVTAKQRSLEECLAPVELSPSEDGLLHFGQKVHLFSQQVRGILAVNPYEKVEKQSTSFVNTVSASDDLAPAVRNTYEIERVDEKDGFEGDVVHFGQEIRIRLNPFGTEISEPAYLHSEMVTGLAASKFSRHQEVTSITVPNGETKWSFQYPDVNDRCEMDGQPVQAGSPLVVRHTFTGSFLASDVIPYNNLFGVENEVHCFHYFSLNKTQNLTSEKKGDITGDIPLRKHGLPNIWTVRTATHGQNDLVDNVQ